MPATQRKCIYGGLTLDVDRHYIGSVTATTHHEDLSHYSLNIMIRFLLFDRPSRTFLVVGSLISAERDMKSTLYM